MAPTPFYPIPADWQVRLVSCGTGRAIGKCEDTPNRGQIPDSAVKDTGGDLGEYWCMDESFTVAHRVLGLACPLLRSGSCEQQRQHALKFGALRTRAEFDRARAGDELAVLSWLMLAIGPDDQGRPHAHHAARVGYIDETGRIRVTGPRGGFFTIEGNAADPHGGASRNGDGCYAGRERGHPDDGGEYQFVDLAALSRAIGAAREAAAVAAVAKVEAAPAPHR